MNTDDFDVDGGTGSSQFVLQSHFVLSCISVEAAVDLQVAGYVLLPVQNKTVPSDLSEDRFRPTENQINQMNLQSSNSSPVKTKTKSLCVNHLH